MTLVRTCDWYVITLSCGPLRLLRSAGGFAIADTERAQGAGKNNKTPSVLPLAETLPCQTRAYSSERKVSVQSSGNQGTSEHPYTAFIFWVKMSFSF